MGIDTGACSQSPTIQTTKWHVVLVGWIESSYWYHRLRSSKNSCWYKNYNFWTPVSKVANLSVPNCEIHGDVFSITTKEEIYDVLLIEQGFLGTTYMPVKTALNLDPWNKSCIVRASSVHRTSRHQRIWDFFSSIFGQKQKNVIPENFRASRETRGAKFLKFPIAFSMVNQLIECQNCQNS